MSKPGKRFRAARETIDRDTLYSLEDAAKLVKGGAKAKFDETIEIAINFGVGPRHPAPRGRIPTQKGGPPPPDVTKAVKGAKGGAVEFRVEKAGLIHAGVGKASFTEQALVDNIRAFADAVMKSKPSGSKGTFLKRVAVTSTMGPGVKIEPASLVGGGAG